MNQQPLPHVAWEKRITWLVRGCVAAVIATLVCIGLTYLSMLIRHPAALLLGPLIAGFALGWCLRSMLAGFFFALGPAVLLAGAVGFMTALAYMSTGTVVPWFARYLFLLYGGSLLGAATLAGALRQLSGQFTSPRALDPPPKG